MQIGHAAVDITPALGVELAGYGYFLDRKATAVLDRLYARAVCIRQGERTIILLASDLIGLPADLASAVKAGLARQLGLARKDIMLVFSHTHTGPATGGLIACGEKDEAYLAGLVPLLLKAGRKASEDLAPLEKILHLEGEIEPIGYNRVDPAGPVAKQVRGLAFYRAGRKPLALVHHACHPVTLGPASLISADYPGKVVTALKEQGWTAVYLNGFCGDIDPGSNQEHWGSGSEKTITGYGSRIAAAFLQGRARELAVEQIHLDSLLIPVQLQLEEYDTARLETEFAKYKNQANSRAVRIWADLQKERLRTKPDPYREKMLVQVFRLADLLFVGFPAEPFFRLGQIVADLLPGYHIFSLGNCNTSMRYIATADDIRKKGYGGHTSNFVYGRLPLLAGEGERLARHVAEALAGLI